MNYGREGFYVTSYVERNWGKVMDLFDELGEGMFLTPCILFWVF